MPFAFIGSVKIYRLSLPKEEKNKRFEKNAIEFYCRNNEIMLKKFNDKKLFFFISKCQTNKIETFERWEEGKKVKKKYLFL